MHLSLIKKISLYTFAIAMCLVLGVGHAGAMVTDAPHNETNNINCSTCHSYTMWWELSPLTRQSPEFVSKIVLMCTTMCHDTASPQDPKDHTSAVMGTRHRTNLLPWEETCVDCHDSHFQPQLNWSVSDASDLFLASGIITIVGSSSGGETLVDYNNLTTKPGWDVPADWSAKTVADRGLIFVVNDGSGDLTYEINAAVETVVGSGQLTLQGDVPPIVNGANFNLIYGQNILSSIPRGTASYPVKFFEPNAAIGGYADFSTNPTKNGLCQVCHTQTNHFRLDGSSSDPEHTNIGLVPGTNCLNCHTHDSGFAHSGDGSGTSCSTLNCHDSGKHAPHLDINIDCSNCHDLANMYTVGGAILLDLATTNVCDNCHHDGAGGPPLVSSSSIKDIWATGTGGLLCDGCHGNPPFYANGSPKANSHIIHQDNSYGCQVCHYSTTMDGTTVSGTISHVNGSYDVNPSPAFSFTYASSSGIGTCNSVSCHGGNSATWGASGPFSCDQCHLGTGDSNDYSYANGTLGRIDSTQWTTTGHGATATYSVSGNPGAGMVCDYCHAGTHNAAGNPFRLANTTGPDGMNGVCQVCHASGAGGFDPDGAGGLALIGSTTNPVDSYHEGPLHAPTTPGGGNGGRFCWDCHDPHGDGNIFMIHDSVTKQSDGLYGIPTTMIPTVFTYNGDSTAFSKNQAPFDGICNACHTIANHYGTDYGDNHRRSYVCTDCHLHNGTTAATGFEPQVLFSEYGGTLFRTDGYPLPNTNVVLRNASTLLIEDSDKTNVDGEWLIMAPDTDYIVEPEQGGPYNEYFYPETQLISSSSLAISFTPDPAPDAPELIDETYYHENPFDTPTVNVLLEWNPVVDLPASNPVRYYVQISKNALFNPLEVLPVPYTTSTNFQFEADAGITYLWRVSTEENIFPGRMSDPSLHDSFFIYPTSSGNCSHVPSDCAELPEW